jgi:hypothetical protein
MSCGREQHGGRDRRRAAERPEAHRLLRNPDIIEARDDLKLSFG